MEQAIGFGNKAIEAGVTGIAVLLAIVVILLVFFLGSIIKIIIDQNNERKTNASDQKVREDTRQTERIQMTEAIKQQTPLLEAIKAQGDKAADRDTQSAVALNAMSQALSLDLQEKVSLKEFWSGTLKELKAMREDYAAGRNDTHEALKVITEHNDKSLSEALQRSIDKHVETHDKIDKLPDALVAAIQPLVNEFKQTLIEAERRFYVAMENAIKKAMEDESGPETKPLDPLAKSPLSLGHTPPTGTQLPATGASV